MSDACTKKVLDGLRSFAEAAFVPIIRDDSLKNLLSAAERIDPAGILEIGTAIGYSCICILSAFPSAHMTSIELRRCRHEFAKKAVEAAGLADRADLILGDAYGFLQDNHRQFDFVFLDGPKGQYLSYLPHILRALRVGGILFCDNLSFGGRVEKALIAGEIKTRKHRAATKKLIGFLQALKEDSRLVVTYSDAGDGTAVVEKIRE